VTLGQTSWEGEIPRGGPEAPVARTLLSEALDALARQPSLLKVDGERVVVVGDTHGDVGTSWAVVSRYLGQGATLLFTGDYVDRGQFQIENILFLLKKANEFPGRLWLLRGNHETPDMNRWYGFTEAVARRYGLGFYENFLSVFSQLPVSAIINGAFLAIHGGIARSLRSVDQLAALPKGVSSPRGILSEILWNDPDEAIDGFAASPRGPGIFRYGFDVLSGFLEANHLRAMIRSHEPREAGAAMEMCGKLYTVFSCRYYGVTPGFLDIVGEEVALGNL